MIDLRAVLTAEEIKKLEKIQTSKAEAQAMKYRFEGVLEELDLFCRRGCCNSQHERGCPHCLSAFHRTVKDLSPISERDVQRMSRYQCNRCTYYAGLPPEERKIRGCAAFSCLAFTFGGVCARDTLLSLHHNMVSFQKLRDGDLDRITANDIVKTYTFALGHIQWANLILKKKGKKK